MMQPLIFPLNWWIARCKGQFFYAGNPGPTSSDRDWPLAATKSNFATDTRPILTICFIIYIYILIYISLQTAHLHVDKGSHWRDLVSFRKLPVRILPLTWETGHLKNWTICFDCRMRCWGWGRWSSVLEGQLKQGFDMFQSWVINKTLSVSRRLLSNLMTNIMVFKADQNYFFVEITWYLLGGKFTRPII